VDRLDKTADLINARRRFLVSQVSRNAEGDRTTSCSLDWLLGLLESEAP
jgi:hypothetical protein